VDAHTTRKPASRFASTLLRRTSLALALALFCASAPGVANEMSKQQMQSLDEQVQEIKEDVLGIASELSGLEEKLLYPSDTQVSVFVALDDADKVRVDSVQVQLDGQVVARHVYSFEELEALKRGGVQRIYTGNVATGEHRLDVVVAGRLPGGSDFGETGSYSFSKGVEPELVGITVAGQAAGRVRVELGDW
jgi:hypothetical protein